MEYFDVEVVQRCCKALFVVSSLTKRELIWGCNFVGIELSKYFFHPRNKQVVGENEEPYPLHGQFIHVHSQNDV